MQAWINDEWWYCGIAVEVRKCGVALTGQYDNALWGIDANYPPPSYKGRPTNWYLREVANELLGEALPAARAKLVELGS